MTDKGMAHRRSADRAGALRAEPQASQAEPLIPCAGVPHPSFFITEELEARGWDKFDLVTRMGGDPERNLLMLDVYFIVGPEKTNCRIGNVMAHQLGVAFDVPAQFFLNLEAAWLAASGIETEGHHPAEGESQ